jgi:hypothetical protein
VPDTETVRIELAFAGGPIVAATLAAAAADEIERAVADGDGLLKVETEEGHISVVASKVSYVKRFRRESAIGFTQ